MNKKKKIILKGKNAARKKKEKSSDRAGYDGMFDVCQISTCRHMKKKGNKEKKRFYFHKAVGCGAYIVG